MSDVTGSSCLLVYSYAKNDTNYTSVHDGVGGSVAEWLACWTQAQ